jgi:predicted RNase H-like HicB family nuclease
MKNESVFNISLTAIMVEDPNIGGYTAFFKQFPDIITEGETQDEAMNNLMYALHDVLLHKSKIKSDDYDIERYHVIEKPLNFTSKEYAN